MTGPNLHRLARTHVIATLAIAALASVTAANGQGYPPGYGSSPQYVTSQYMSSYQAASGPSGSVSANVVNFNGRGSGVLGRAGHVVGDGIGRGDSISYIEAMPYATFGDNLLFGDARLVRANEGGLAWSFGAGFRRYFSDVDAVFGVNGYFDRDQITTGHFKGWGIGAELLSNVWEWRGNLYKPFGETRVRTDTGAVAGTSSFVGNELTFSRRDVFNTALEGYDTEFGMLLPGRFAHDFQIRAFGGGYFFEGEGVDIPGWKARLQADLTDFIELNLAFTNDTEFDSTLNFGVAVELGGYRENVPPRHSRYRLGEPVRRNYTFAATNVAMVVPDVTAFNPETNGPFNIVHVSDAAGPIQNGTAEFPFPDIATGQAANADIVFVHAGSVYDTAGTGNTVSLLQGSRILGEGLINGPAGATVATHFLEDREAGPVMLASSSRFTNSIDATGLPTLLRPTLRNYTGNAVTLARDSEFSGFIVESPQAGGGHGIYVDSISNAVMNQNLISGALGDGIFLENVTGVHQITDTTIQNAAGAGFHVDGGDALITFAQTLSGNPGLGAIQNAANLAIHVENTLEDGLVTFGSRAVTLAGTSEVLDTFGGTIDGAGDTGVLIDNSDGDVTIDNLTLINSTGNGIEIVGGSGEFRFESSIRSGVTTLTGISGSSVQITDLEEEGSVIFDSQVLIEDRNGTGINVEGIAGSVSFEDNVRIQRHDALNAPGGPAVSLLTNMATADITFEDDLVIEDANGVGILIQGNQFDATTNNRASITFGNGLTDDVTMTNVSGINLQVIDDASSFRFGGDLTINGRGATGIQIAQSTGRFTFAGVTDIDNANLVTDPALAILNSAAHVGFDDFIASDTLGDPAVPEAGVLLIGNTADNIGNDADIRFDYLEITGTTANATSLIAQESDPLNPLTTGNSSIIVLSGLIETDPGSAVAIRNSGIDMTFESITSADSPDVAIRIEDTFRAGQAGNSVFDSNFHVTGDLAQNRGSGGSIQTAATAGAFLVNAGVVRLNQMEFEDNEIGVVAAYNNLTGVPLQNTLPRIETGIIELDGTDFTDNNIGVIQGLNIPELILSDAEYQDNGDAGNAQQHVLLRYTEDPSNNVDDFEHPYIVDISDIDFESDVNTFNIIDIRNGDFAGNVFGVEAPLDVRVLNSQLDVFGGPGFSILDPPNNNVRNQGRGLLVEWAGPLEADINNNTFLLQADTDSQRGIEIYNANTSDESNISINENVFTIESSLDQVNDITLPKWATWMELEGPGEIEINGNVVTINASATVGDLVGFHLDFAERVDLQMLNNQISATAATDADDTRGIFVDRISEDSIFEFDQNVIQLLGPESRAFEVDAAGRIALRRGSGAGNILIIGTTGDDFLLDFSGPEPTGSWLINGFEFPEETGLFIP